MGAGVDPSANKHVPGVQICRCACMKDDGTAGQLLRKSHLKQRLASVLADVDKEQRSSMRMRKELDAARERRVVTRYNRLDSQSHE